MCWKVVETCSTSCTSFACAGWGLSSARASAVGLGRASRKRGVWSGSTLSASAPRSSPCRGELDISCLPPVPAGSGEESEGAGLSGVGESLSGNPSTIGSKAETGSVNPAAARAVVATSCRSERPSGGGFGLSSAGHSSGSPASSGDGASAAGSVSTRRAAPKGKAAGCRAARSAGAVAVAWKIASNAAVGSAAGGTVAAVGPEACGERRSGAIIFDLRRSAECAFIPRKRLPAVYPPRA